MSLTPHLIDATCRGRLFCSFAQPSIYDLTRFDLLLTLLQLSRSIYTIINQGIVTVVLSLVVRSQVAVIMLCREHTLRRARWRILSPACSRKMQVHRSRAVVLPFGRSFRTSHDNWTSIYDLNREYLNSRPWSGGIPVNRRHLLMLGCIADVDLDQYL